MANNAVPYRIIPGNARNIASVFLHDAIFATPVVSQYKEPV
jgi:hypothetical protein